MTSGGPKKNTLNKIRAGFRGSGTGIQKPLVSRAFSNITDHKQNQTANRKRFDVLVISEP